MAYSLKSVTIRTDNTKEGMGKIEELWRDVTSGKLPILFDSANTFRGGISPISMYSNYEDGSKGQYDLSIMGVESDFFRIMEQKVADGLYKKYDVADENGDLLLCTRKAWESVWNDTTNGSIKRAFTYDYESSVPKEYTHDGKAHCFLYIAIE